MMRNDSGQNQAERAQKLDIGNRVNQFLHSKNSLENTDADQIEALKFKQNDESVASSKKSDVIVCRICLSELDLSEEDSNPIISP